MVDRTSHGQTKPNDDRSKPNEDTSNDILCWDSKKCWRSKQKRNKIHPPLFPETVKPMQGCRALAVMTGDWANV